MPNPSPADIVWVAKEVFCEPETVLPLPDNTLLVSNVCGFNKAGNGFLTLLDLNGDVAHPRVIKDLDAPLGMAFLDHKIFVVDKNTIQVFSWPGYEFLKAVQLPTQVANDVAVHPNGTMYVTDTAAGNVVKVDTEGKSKIFIGANKFPGANGIEIRENQLFVGGERLWLVNLINKTIETQGPDWLVDIDGIEFEPDGVVQVTPVGGPLVRLEADAITVLGGEGVSSANHGYSPEASLAFIPTGFDNTVIAIRVH